MMETIQHSEHDNLPLGRLFASSVARILDFLLINNDFKYTEAEISDLAQIPQRTLQRGLKTLLDENLIKRTKNDSNAFVYQLNSHSKRAEFLLRYLQTTIDENLDSLKLTKSPI